MQLSGKRVLIMGLGINEGGLAAARYAAEQGAVVRVTDLRSAAILAPSIRELAAFPIEYILEQHREEDFLWAEVVIRNPGVPRSSSYLQLAQANGAVIAMEFSIFLDACRAYTIGITGTRGKSTSATLLHRILSAAGMETLLGGNLTGVATLPLLPLVTPSTRVVLELSSWQLEGLESLHKSPSFAIVTNLYPDHLNTYASMQEYADAKSNIFRYQLSSDTALFNYDNEWTRSMGESAPGVVWFVSTSQWCMFRRDTPEEKRTLPSFGSPLSGQHNQENIAIVTAAALLLGVSEEDIGRSIGAFHGLPYRLQTIGEYDSIQYINDSASTTPVSLLAALHAYSHLPVVLVAGGTSKNLPLGDLPDTILDTCRAVCLLNGSGSGLLYEAMTQRSTERDVPNPCEPALYDSLDECLSRAVQLARPGDVILFSPGFTSFGMFLNEFDRGEQYTRWVDTYITACTLHS